MKFQVKFPGNQIQFPGSQNPLDRIFYTYVRTCHKRGILIQITGINKLLKVHGQFFLQLETTMFINLKLIPY